MGTKRGNTYLFNPKLPFDFNSEAGAYFIAAILFDGGIDRQYKPHYGNVPFKQRKRIVDSAMEVFGELKNRESNPNRGYMVRFPKCIGIVLNYCFKIGIGNKMYSNNKVPAFVFNYPKELKSVFLRQAYDDEGNVAIKKKMINIVGVTAVKKEEYKLENTMNKYNLLNDIKKLLLDLEIGSNPIRISQRFYYNKQYSKKGDYYRHSFRFSISDRKNLKKFNDVVGFNLEYKKTNLQKMLSSYKEWQLRKGEIHKIALEKAKELQDRFGYFDNVMLTKEIKRMYRQTVRITDKMLEDGKIKVLENAVPIGKGWIPRKFILK